ncbi:MAG: rhomboid family intramembrane serine protease, partial [Pauljensenia sp.]
MSMPSYGQRSDPRAAPDCPRHPGARAVDYCKRCNRPMCVDCVVPTEVRSICVDCAASKRGWSGRVSRASAAGAPVVTYALMGICVLMFALTWLVPSVESSLMLVPARLMSQPWTILTGAFLHGGIMHIGFNMLTLYWV